jgi:hypothetical protein
MITISYRTITASFLGLFLSFYVGCGYDPRYYEDEVIAFEAKVQQPAVQKNHDSDSLELAEGAADEFGITRFGYMIPWVYPLFDYYLEPIPYEIPVSSYYSVIDFLPPMYYDYYLNPPWEDDDDHFRNDDNDC